MQTVVNHTVSAHAAKAVDVMRRAVLASLADDTRADAPLLAAWQAYLNAVRRLDAAWHEGGASDLAAQRELNRCIRRLKALPARTVEGALIKLRMTVIDASTCMSVSEYYAGIAPEPAAATIGWDTTDPDEEHLLEELWIALRRIENTVALGGLIA